MLAALAAALVAASPPAAEARPRLVVTDLRALAVRPELAEQVGQEVALAARDSGRYEVLTQSDLRDMLGFEKQKLLLGCDAGDARCFSTVLGGGVLKARYLLTGSLGEVSGVAVVNLKLIDVPEARVVNQASAEVKDRSELLDTARRATFNLLGAPYVASQRVVEDVWRQQLLVFGGYQALASGALDGGFAVHVAHSYRAGHFAIGAEGAWFTGDHRTSVGGFPGQPQKGETLGFDAFRVGARLAFHPLRAGPVDPFLALSAGFQSSRFAAGEGANTAQPSSARDSGGYDAVTVGALLFPRARFAAAVELGYAGVSHADVMTRRFDVYSLSGLVPHNETVSPGGAFALAGVRIAF